MPAENQPEPGEPERSGTVNPDVVVPRTKTGLALGIIAAAAIVILLREAWEILLPIAVGILIGYAFRPLVSGLTRMKIPRAIGSALVLAVFVGATGFAVYSLREDALAIVEDVPAAARKLRQSMRQLQDGEGAVQSLNEAVEEIEKTAEAGASATEAEPGVTRVQVEEKPFDLTQYLWRGSMGVLGLGGEAIMVIFLAYFLLASGDLYRRKLIKIVGPTLSRQRVTVQILDEITAKIERFLLVHMAMGGLVALASSLAFYWLGLERAVFWGILAGLLNSIPYFGAMIVMGGVAAIGFLQFGTFDMALKTAAISLVITSLEGFLLTPYLLGKSLRMNGIAVFVGLLFWGWVWGIWGVLLAVPMMVVLKAICDHIEGLRGIGELLGE